MSRVEIISWSFAVLIVVIMGFIALHGPFNKINKGLAASGPTPAPYPVLHVKIVTNPKTVGQYVPKTITAHVGQTIVFTNVSNAVHTVTATTNGVFNSGNIDINGPGWSYVTTKAGTYPYYCVYHPLMHGKIVVE